MSIALESQSERIRSRMAALRLHMHKDARRIVANTNRLLDWRDYVHQFPKAVVAAGLLIGFVAGPGRKVVPSVNLSQDSIDELLKQRQHQQAALPPQRSDVASGALKILAGLAMSGVSVLLRKGVENYFRSSTNPDGIPPNDGRGNY
jgi:hypothetical protein